MYGGTGFDMASGLGSPLANRQAARSLPKHSHYRQRFTKTGQSVAALQIRSPPNRGTSTPVLALTAVGPRWSRARESPCQSKHRTVASSRSLPHMHARRPVSPVGRPPADWSIELPEFRLFWSDYATVDVALSEPRALLAFGVTSVRRAEGGWRWPSQQKRLARLIRSFAVQVRYPGRRRWSSSSSRTTAAGITGESSPARAESLRSPSASPPMRTQSKPHATSATARPQRASSRPVGTSRLISPRAAPRAPHAIAPTPGSGGWMRRQPQP